MGEEYRIIGANDQKVLTIGNTRRLIPIQADGHLIAAAPDLLTALERFATEQGQTLNTRALEQALAAIKKARGE